MTAKPPQVFFYFLSGAKKGKIEASDAQVVRIGRQPYCELQLDPYQDIPASGDHCHVIREPNGAYFLLDSGSTFGTFLNGNRVEGRVPLNTGDVIECGKDPAQNREGPRLKFYLESDVRKCPVCSGPVYKRHFKCPDCGKKTCLRCIEFSLKVCRACAPARAARASAPATPETATDDGTGFEVLDDDEDVQAKRPAKVIVKGKEAEKLKRKRAKTVGAEVPAGEGGANGHADTDLDAPFCDVCKDFVKGQRFKCPACAREMCAKHRAGRTCQPCAAAAAPPPAPPPPDRRTRVLGAPVPPAPVPGARPPLPAITPAPPEDDGIVAELVVPEVAPNAAAKPAGKWGGPMRAPAPAPPTRAPRPTPPPAPRPPAPVVDVDVPQTMRFAPGATAGLARAKQDQTPTRRDFVAPGGVQPGAPPYAPPAPARTGTASCARCRGPLGAGTFCCRGCRRILCSAHLAVDDACEDCYVNRRAVAAGSGSGLAPLPPPPPPLPRMPGAARPGMPPLPPAPPTMAFDRDRVRRSLDDTSEEPAMPAPRPAGHHTLELPASDVMGQPPGGHVLPPFNPDYAPTIAEIEALDMMPLLDTEKEEDAARPREPGTDDDLARPLPGTSSDGAGLDGLSFVCPHCDAPLPAAARACPKCRRAL